MSLADYRAGYRAGYVIGRMEELLRMPYDARTSAERDPTPIGREVDPWEEAESNE